MSRHHRLSSDENLDTVLGLISAEDPMSSPLLSSLADATEQHKSLFRGSLGASQYQLLVNWIKRAAVEKGPTAPVQPAPVAASPLLIQPAGAEEPVANAAAPAVSGQAPITRSPPNVLADPVQQMLNRAQPVPPLSNDAIREILLEQAPDAFDPDEFNRLMHGIEANR